MRITNCKDPEMVSYLAPWFVPVEKSIVDICIELKDRLENEPEDTLCLVATENEKCHGILVAYMVDDYVWIWQARSRDVWSSHYPKENHTKDVFGLLIEWAKIKNARDIRMKCPTKKLRKFFNRNYGFDLLEKGEMVYDFRSRDKQDNLQVST